MWKKIKNAAKKVGKAVVQGVKQVVNVVKEVINRIVGIVDFFGSLFGLMLAKRIRVRIIVLADDTGKPLLNATDLDASMVAMKDVFKNESNTRLKPDDASIITVDTEPAPDYALTVRCGVKAYGDDFGDRGWYFGWRASQHAAGFLTGYATPVTVVIVHQVSSRNGCSMGPLTDYVTVEAGIVNRDPRVVAHEVGHACGLWHWNKQHYLMRPDVLHGPRINWLQRSVFRNSRHVTFL